MFEAFWGMDWGTKLFIVAIGALVIYSVFNGSGKGGSGKKGPPSQ